MRLELLEEPTFIEEAEAFRVELPLRGLMSTAERGWLTEFERAGVMRPEERVLLLPRSREGRLTNARAGEALGVDSTEVRTRLRRSRDAGILLQHGTRGRAYYTVGAIGPSPSDEETVLAEAPHPSDCQPTSARTTGLDRIASRDLLRRPV